MAKTIKITSVYGVMDNGELVNIVVEGHAYEMTHILLTVWGNKQHRNVIRQISSGEFTESIEQEIIKSAQCQGGDQIIVKAYCLDNSAISDTWRGELQCLEIGKKAAATLVEAHEAEEVAEAEEVKEETEEVEEKKASLEESLPIEIPAPEKEKEEGVAVAEGLEIEEAEATEEERVVIEEPRPLEIPALEKEEEAVPAVAEDLVIGEAEEFEEREEREEIEEEARGEEVEEAFLSKPLTLEIPAPEKEEEAAAVVAEDLAIEEAEEAPVGEAVTQLRLDTR